MLKRARIVQTHTDTYEYQLLKMSWFNYSIGWYSTEETFKGSTLYCRGYDPELTTLQHYKKTVDTVNKYQLEDIAEKKTYKASKVKRRVIYP